MADYISRDAAIERFCNVYCGCSPEECGFKIPQDGAEECAAVRALKETPAADVRPVVRARWEDETGYIFSNLAQRVYCPACKSFAYFYPITAKNFCPSCGADMMEQGAEGGA